MATDLQTIAEYFKAEKLEFVSDAEQRHIQTGFRMASYKDTEERPAIVVVIQLEEAGEMVRMVAPFLYKCLPQNFPAVLQAVNEATRRFKLVKFHLDPSDGEIRAEVDLPLEDAPLTRRQLMRSLMVIPQVIDHCDTTLRAAVDGGEAIPIEDPSELQRAFEDFLQSRRAERSVLATPGLDE